MAYTLDTHMIETAQIDRAAALAFFLMENAGGIFGSWRGTMSVADQRKLFGFVVGRGTIVINGETEEVRHLVSVCFKLSIWPSP